MPRSAEAVRLVTLVVPTLREEEIAGTLAALGEHLAAVRGYDFEIILVDDSAESYKRLMDEATGAFNARFGPHGVDRAERRSDAPSLTARRADGPRKGKGAALRVGVLASRGEVVFWMDADLPVPLENIDRFLDVFAEGSADFIVAERPFDRNLSQPVRFVASRALFALQRAFVFQSRAFTDTQCGFKAFRGALARRIAERQVVDGGMADIEYLYAALQSGARPARIAVIPNPETRESKINVKRALVVDPLDLVRIKLGSIAGRYRERG
jgi:glycosyltransferase involved in cell wall biosynthesis